MEEVPNNQFDSKELAATMQLLFGNLFMAVTYVAQRYAMTVVQKPVQPITYNTCRFALSTLLLVVSRPWLQSHFHTEVDRSNSSTASKYSIEYLRNLWFWGGLCGLAAVGGSAFQQYGLRTLSAGKTSFITGLYVIMVPIVERCIPGLGPRLQARTWIGAAVSLLGVYFLSGCAGGGGDQASFTTSAGDRNESTSAGGFRAVTYGEICVFISTLFWVCCIILADIGLKKVDSVSFTLVQFFVITTGSLPLAVLLEPNEWDYPFPNVRGSIGIILFVGFTETIGVMLGMLGQMYVPPTKTALLFSLEALASATLGYSILGEKLSYSELVGCALMICANMIAFLSPSSISASTSTTSRSPAVVAAAASVITTARQEYVLVPIDTTVLNLPYSEHLISVPDNSCNTLPLVQKTAAPLTRYGSI